MLDFFVAEMAVKLCLAIMLSIAARQSGVLENSLFLWALEQGAAAHDLKVLEEKFASLNIKEGSELVTMAMCSGLEFKQVFRRIILFLKRPSAVQVAVHGNLRLEFSVSEWLQDTVWTVR